jgi:hypothetical protein
MSRQWPERGVLFARPSAQSPLPMPRRASRRPARRRGVRKRHFPGGDAPLLGRGRALPAYLSASSSCALSAAPAEPNPGRTTTPFARSSTIRLDPLPPSKAAPGTVSGRNQDHRPEGSSSRAAVTKKSRAILSIFTSAPVPAKASRTRSSVYMYNAQRDL